MAFSYDHHAFLFDAAYLPTFSPLGMPLQPQQAEELNSSAPSCFLYSYPAYPSAEMIPSVSGTDHAKTYGRSSSPDSATAAPSVDSATGDSPKIGEPHSSEKKRKKKDEACFMTTTATTTSIHDKDEEVSKSYRHGKTHEKKRKRDADSGEPPAGYIQVRARRGQATDSHSLAERVRRERISQRMKMLQGLVPGCEKANGKAHMLDEIINYVQSLQNQVEFLSMRLASLSPMLYGFALDMDDYSNLQEKIMRRMPQTVPPADHRIHLEPTTSGNGSNNYHGVVVDNSAPHLLQGQGPNFPQDSGSSVVQVGEERLLLRQIELANMCFQ